MCLARAISACLFHVSASGAIITAATANSQRLSQQNPHKTWASLVELGRTSRHFIVHFEKIPTKKFPRYTSRRCALLQPIRHMKIRFHKELLTQDTWYQVRSTFFLFWAGPGGDLLIWLTSLPELKPASRLAISCLRQPTCRLKSVSWLVG